MRQDILSENADEPVHISLPENLRQLIEQQLEQLSSEELEMLETASVAGAEFSAAAIATSLNAATETVEAQCDALSRRIQFVQARGVAEWPDGTVAARYGFIHTLYQEVLYDRISAGRRTRLHQQIGLRREMGSGDQTREIAAELALHFVRGRDIPRAVQYAQYAGENAVQRSADQEAIPHLNTALKIIANLPPTAERMQRELTLLITLGTALTRHQGLVGSGARTALRTCLRALPSSRGNATTVSRPARLEKLLYESWRVADRTPTLGTDARPCPKRP